MLYVEQQKTNETKVLTQNNVKSINIIRINTQRQYSWRCFITDLSPCVCLCSVWRRGRRPSTESLVFTMALHHFQEEALGEIQLLTASQLIRARGNITGVQRAAPYLVLRAVINRLNPQLQRLENKNVPAFHGCSSFMHCALVSTQGYSGIVEFTCPGCDAGF